MILTPAQKQIAKDTHRYRVVCAGRRFGKSTLAVWEMFGKAVAKNEQRIVYIAPTYQQARDIVWQELIKITQPIAKKVNESRLEVTVTTQEGGTSLIVLRGWEAVETLRGQRFDFMVIDEIAMMRNFWLNWQEVLRPTLTDSNGDVLFISTPKGFNHFYDLYNLERDPQKGKDFKSFHFTTYDNPHMQVEEIDKARQEMTEDRFAQEYLADFRKQEGLVYKEFSREKHLFDDKTPIGQIVERLAGVDFGFTNPTAVLPIDKDSDNTYWVRSEYYKTNKTTAEIIEHCKTLKANTFYPDPAEPDRIEEMTKAGLYCRDVSKDITKGIDSVRELLKNGKLRIHASCVNLISEFETYHYPEKKPEKNEPETPVKENDHALDALRYALHNNAPTVINLNQDWNLYGNQYF